MPPGFDDAGDTAGLASWLDGEVAAGDPAPAADGLALGGRWGEAVGVPPGRVAAYQPPRPARTTTTAAAMMPQAGMRRRLGSGGSAPGAGSRSGPG